MCHVRHRRASQPEACLSCPRFSQHQCGVNICPVATRSDHAVAHTSLCSGCYVRRRWSIGCISGYSHGTFRRGGLLGRRFNPAPGWPPPPPGFVPPPHWQPDPSWPPAPPGWQIWVDDGIPDQRQPTDPPSRAGRGHAASNGGFPAASTGAFPTEPTGVQSRPDAFGSGAADAPWAGDFATGPGDAPPWGGDFTGPQTAALRGASTQAYTPGATGPQAPYDSGDLFSPQDPFTRQGPGPGGPPGGPGRRAGAPGKVNAFAVASLILGLLGITV